ncbi:MAG: hypothetical protein AAF805_05005 [Planctomycetota bacterium]
MKRTRDRLRVLSLLFSGTLFAGLGVYRAGWQPEHSNLVLDTIATLCASLVIAAGFGGLLDRVSDNGRLRFTLFAAVVFVTALCVQLACQQAVRLGP